MHELRYFKHVVALSDNIDILWLEKCEMILTKRVRWHEALKIYFDGEEEWLFDYLPTRQQASQALVESCLSPFVCAMHGCSCIKRFRSA